MKRINTIYGVKTDDIRTVVDGLESALDMDCWKYPNGDGGSFREHDGKRGANVYVLFNVQESEGETYLDAPDFPEYPVIVSVHGHEAHPGLLEAIEGAPGVNAVLLERRELPDLAEPGGS